MSKERKRLDSANTKSYHGGILRSDAVCMSKVWTGLKVEYHEREREITCQAVMHRGGET